MITTVFVLISCFCVCCLSDWVPMTISAQPIKKSFCSKQGLQYQSYFTSITDFCDSYVTDDDKNKAFKTLITPVTQYLSRVLQVQQTDADSLLVDSWEWQCGDLLLSDIDESYRNPVLNAFRLSKFGIFVTFQPYDQVVFARPCQFHAKTLRPTVAVVNVWPQQTQGDVNDMLILVQELLHLLALNRYYFDVTPSMWINSTTGIPLDADDIIKTARRPEGHIARYIVTPNVRRFLQQHYACAGAIGGELENFEMTNSAGMYWESRVYYEDILSSTGGDKITNLTLAVLEDTGWYRVVFDAARPGQLALGRYEGCVFFNGLCNATTQQLYDTDYCLTDSSLRRCTVDKRATGDCVLKEYPSPIPSTMQYLKDSPYSGGSPQMEYCSVRKPFQFCRGDTACFDNIQGPSQCFSLSCSRTNVVFYVGDKVLRCPLLGEAGPSLDDPTWFCGPREVLCNDANVVESIQSVSFTFNAVIQPNETYYDELQGFTVTYSLQGITLTSSSVVSITVPQGYDFVSPGVLGNFSLINYNSQTKLLSLEYTGSENVTGVDVEVSGAVMKMLGESGPYASIDITFPGGIVRTLKGENPATDDVLVKIPAVSTSSCLYSNTMALNLTINDGKDLQRAFIEGAVKVNENTVNVWLQFPIEMIVIPDGFIDSKTVTRNNYVALKADGQSVIPFRFYGFSTNFDTLKIPSAISIILMSSSRQVKCYTLPESNVDISHPTTVLSKTALFDVIPTPSCPSCDTTLVFRLTTQIPLFSVNSTLQVSLPRSIYLYETRGFQHGPTDFSTTFVDQLLPSATTECSPSVRIHVSTLIFLFPCAINGTHVTLAVNGFQNPTVEGDPGNYSVILFSPESTPLMYLSPYNPSSDLIQRDLCGDKNCSGHGSCTTFRTCECLSGFAGSKCDQCDVDMYPPGDCSQRCRGDNSDADLRKLCSSHGIQQLESSGNCVCVCDAGYCGALCNTKACNTTSAPEKNQTVYLGLVCLPQKGDTTWFNITAFGYALPYLEARIRVEMVRVVSVSLTAENYVRVIFTLENLSETLRNDIIDQMKTNVIEVQSGLRVLPDIDLAPRSTLATSLVEPNRLPPIPTGSSSVTSPTTSTTTEPETPSPTSSSTFLSKFDDTAFRNEVIAAIVICFAMIGICIGVWWWRKRKQHRKQISGAAGVGPGNTYKNGGEEIGDGVDEAPTEMRGPEERKD